MTKNFIFRLDIDFDGMSISDLLEKGQSEFEKFIAARNKHDKKNEYIATGESHLDIDIGYYDEQSVYSIFYDYEVKNLDR